jgi:hypothetical protein
MALYAVEFSPQAKAQLEAIHDWWCEHRQASRDLLSQELTAILRHLQRSPYRPDDTARKIYIDAIWYAGRGQAPPIL